MKTLQFPAAPAKKRKKTQSRVVPALCAHVCLFYFSFLPRSRFHSGPEMQTEE